MASQDKDYYNIGDLQMHLQNEGFTRYAINRAIDRLKLLGLISVEVDPLDERARRVKKLDYERILTYLRTGQ
jgi:DNA-binding MarR family transcriptional regulator